MGRDWFSQGQLGLAAAVPATAGLAATGLAATGLAATGLAAAGLARAAAASGNKTDKDAATMARGGIRRTRRRGLITGVSFIEPSLDSIAGRFPSSAAHHGRYAVRHKQAINIQIRR
jgi:hypothetical protein